MGKHHPCLLINPCLLAHVPREGRGNPLHFAQEKLPCSFSGHALQGEGCFAQADVYVEAKLSCV